jgi:cephalosporin hydroxylase
VEDEFVTSVHIPLKAIPWEPWTRFVGQPAGHSPYVYQVISDILLRNEVSAIIEVGTMYGALTMYLGLWGLRLDVPVISFDIDQNLSEPVARVLDGLGVVRYEMDVFSERAVSIIQALATKPVYLICDGGDKPREVETFTPLLPIGSVISVHDWGDEIHDIKADAKVHYFEADDWTAHGANMATIVKIGEHGEEEVHRN